LTLGQLSTIIDAVKKVDDEDANPSICCTCCQEEYDEHNDAVQFFQECQLLLCDAHAIVYQKDKKTKNHELVPIEQIPNYQKHYESYEHKKMDQVEEESLQMTNNGQSLSNSLQKHICCVCHNQLSERAKTTNEDVLFFCSKQCLEHYDRNKNENVDLSLIPDEVIDHVMIPLIDAKVLHYLKCANSKWRTKIEEYAKKYLPVFKFVAKFGSKGSGNGQFDGPWFVATDEQCNIYVSDCRNHRIQIFDSNGQWMKSIGSNGLGNDQFNGPKGNVQFNEPMGIAFNSKSHMFVADENNHRIVEFDQNMQFVKTFGSKGKGKGQFKSPLGIAVDADDNIVVVDKDNRCLQIFSKNGKWKQTIGKIGFGDGKFNLPCDVAVCKTSGRIFVSDSHNHRVQAFNSDGKFLFKFGSEGSENGQFQDPHGLALSNCGQYLFVCDCYNDRIQLFNAMNGRFVKSYASYGSGDGQFYYPFGICVSPSGKIIVSESGSNDRVQIFE
jgi:DNA-binding beta-propeller fold protein YncE